MARNAASIARIRLIAGPACGRRHGPERTNNRSHAGGRNGSWVPGGWASRSATTYSAAGLCSRPMWLPGTAMFSASGASSSMHENHDTTPSVRE